jgi:hypothetical protein
MRGQKLGFGTAPKPRDSTIANGSILEIWTRLRSLNPGALARSQIQVSGRAWYNDIAFEENVIPEKRLKAIKNVHYGANAKMVIPLARASLTRNFFIADQAIAFSDAGPELLWPFLYR